MELMPDPIQPQIDTLSKIISSVLHKKCITYRRHGLNGELLKPMRHRFEVKGGESLSQAFARNVASHNPMFEKLSGRR